MNKEQIRQELIELFRLAADYYRPELEVANEDVSHPDAYTPQRGIDARKAVKLLIESNDEVFTKDFISYFIEGVNGFVVDTKNIGLAFASASEMRAIIEEENISEAQRQLLSKVVLNQFVDFRSKNRLGLN